MLFHQHRGTVGVTANARDGRAETFYRDSGSNFAIDSGLQVPALPAGIDERLYEPGVRHALIAGNDVVAGGPMPWEPGDQIIERVSALLDAQNTRRKREIDELLAKNAQLMKR
jgi:hypothetical protein